uniref:lysosomal acid glucosylceramidase isoform X2 n=1 Tax=Myxine glutinosa TaxID=7769 RepID=UPI00358E0EDC
METIPLGAARSVLFLCGYLFSLWTGSTAQDPRTEQQERSCVPVRFHEDSNVCACNGSYCDIVGVVPRPDRAHLLVYTSSQAGDRLLHHQIPLLPGPPTNSTKDVIFSFNPTTRYQRIKGFGGAVTDSVAINIKSLSPSAQKNLLRAYFAPEGIEYNIIRVPIASSDFSTRAYTYDDVPGDLQLKHFSLAMEDVKYKIPVLQEIANMASRPLSLFASPWTAPPWMKTNNNFTGNATIRGRPGGAYYKSWANYFVKFLDEYEKRNVSFWAVTVQNEPTNAPFVSFQSTGFTPELERDFIVTDLGPALQARRGGRVKIMAIDDNRLLLPMWPEVILSNRKAEQYVDGFALHWYLDDFVPASLTLNTTHHLYPNIFLLATEACVSSFPGERPVQLGNWERGERYSHNIIQQIHPGGLAACRPEIQQRLGAASPCFCAER